MKKSLIAGLFLVMCAIASGSQATPAATGKASRATAPQFGACRWYCGSKSFTTQSACQAACSNDFCEQIC